MTDRSVPTGDRDPWPATPAGPRAGLTAARDALASTQPVPTFVDEVLDVARRAGWTVIRPGPGGDGGQPTLLLLRDGRLLATWISSAPPGYQADQLRAAMGRVVGVSCHVWSPRGGIALVEAVLRRGAGAIDFDCGQPGYQEPDGGRRGD